MSDIAAPSTVTESAPATAEPAAPAAPQSTADIAANVLSTLEAEDQQASEAMAEPIAGDAAAVTPKPAAAPPAAELSPAMKFLQQQGHQAKKSDGRPVYLPVQTVEKMLERYAGQQLSGVESQRTALDTEVTELRTHVQNLRQGVAGDPDAFMRELAGHDPRYAKYLQPQAAASQPQTPPIAEMPQPDVPLGDGSRTYSVEGIQKLIEWAVDAKMLPKVDERLKPYAERDKQEQQRAEAAKAQQALQTRTRTQMEEAQTWAGFGMLPGVGAPLDTPLTEFQVAVLSRLQADTAKAKAAGRRPSMTLREAYLEVHAERLSTDHNKVRESVLKDLASAPKSTAVARSGGETPRAPGPMTTQEIAARTLERLERGA